MRTVHWLAVALAAAGLTSATAVQAAGPAMCDGRLATIVGSPGDDRITGTSGSDVILAGGGRDSVDGRGGDDRVCGGAGADVIVGGPGDDRLFGEGNQFHADRGGVHFRGDVLDGGAGDDLLDVGPTPDADSLAGERVEFLTVPGAVAVDLAAGTSTGQGDDVIRVRRNMSVRTGDGDDTILGTRRADSVDAGPGNDTVRLMRGQDTYVERRTSLPDDDVVDTGGGYDTVDVVSGADTVMTGREADSVGLRGRGPHRVETGPGSDLVVAGTSDAPGSSYDMGPGAADDLSLDVGPLRGEGGVLPIRIDIPAGQLLLTGPAGPVTVEIHGIEDFVLGKEFRIDFLGSDADESLFLAPVGSIPVHALMGGGDDRVWGSRGDDHLDGGAGVDTAYGDEGDDTCVGIEHPTSC
ncbi:calcium-binding protein [Nocardioides seonyuensis]|uniref:Calcium-binding protein n=1 Tax=Nocardioides seonyuensis TaxID=2518371 RepID=A0A4P7IES2_9ACTN|nr:calcium-binding protein [Nocardioides seonyuensis]QBX54171.1 calcium-binding protein [Nocardioides seonyuensis]